MKTVEVKLTVSRAGPGAANRGDTIKVSVAEAARMLAAGQIQLPSAKTGKLIEEYEAASAAPDVEAAVAKAVSEDAQAQGGADAETADAKTEAETAAAKPVGAKAKAETAAVGE